VQRQHTAPYTPQQNGVVERRNQSVVNMARALLKGRGVPSVFWGEAIATAVWILNRVPTKALEGVTPYEAWHGRRPDISYFRTFGCTAFVKKVKPNLKKLEDHGTPVVFIGYEPGAKAWRFYDPVARHAVVSRDAVFDETASWTWEREDGVPTNSELVVEYHDLQIGAGDHYIDITGGGPESPTHSAHASGAPAPSPGAPTVDTSAPPSTPQPPEPGAGPLTPEFVSPPPNAEEYLDADNDDVEPRYRMLDNVLGNAAPPGLAARQVAAELHLQIEGEPASFTEAEKLQPWRRAMLEEMESIESNCTWRLVPLPPGHRPIGLKWVYKTKRDAAGEVVKHKVRLVVKGYVQQAGVDFDEVFAPVARIESVRLLLALAAQEGWPVHHMDVKSAFLNGELNEEVYVRQPPGFVVAGKENMVLRLDKALYGL
jgi:hypothetical protein